MSVVVVLAGCNEAPSSSQIQACVDALAVGDGTPACKYLFLDSSDPEECRNRVAAIRRDAPYLPGSRIRVLERSRGGGDTLAEVVVEAQSTRGSATVVLTFACKPSGSCDVRSGEELLLLSWQTKP